MRLLARVLESLLAGRKQWWGRAGHATCPLLGPVLRWWRAWLRIMPDPACSLAGRLHAYGVCCEPMPVPQPPAELSALPSANAAFTG